MKSAKEVALGIISETKSVEETWNDHTSEDHKKLAQEHRSIAGKRERVGDHTRAKHHFGVAAFHDEMASKKSKKD